jgi:hypothetical protein
MASSRTLTPIERWRELLVAERDRRQAAHGGPAGADPRAYQQAHTWAPPLPKASLI